MHFFTVRHKEYDFDLSASSTQLKTISWPRPPGYKVSSSSLSLSAPSTASLSASLCSGSPDDHGLLQKEFVRMILIAT